ncbi:BTAD domain-containing putative transcriptional regulator [Kitasatospora sp. NPDC057015]|uniref:AfsR/SARP family transcriptional regulator n=1 Tax=Kitasatospora sp. NPDC057015 TaxID=3346001 RepID=UPI00364287AC
MRIGILGPLEMRDGAARPVEVSGQRLRTLLIRLAIDGGRTVTSERLIEDLWESSPPAAPGNALHTLVSRLRGAGGRDLVAAVAGGYRLTVPPGEIDAVEFERLVASARGLQDAGERAAVLRRALGLWRGPALAEVADAAFASATANRLEELRLTATEGRVEADLLLGEGSHLVAELEGLTTAYPLRERLRGQLMRALFAAGRQATALDVYEDTRRELAERLGVDPSPELAALHLAILRGELVSEPAPRPGPPVDRAPAQSPARTGARDPVEDAGAALRSPRRTNLPTALTSFVGREEECATVERLLRTARLVTLTGPGGAGKTRLAAEVTAGLVEESPDGVWLVPLAPVSSPADVPQAVLVAVGVPDVMRVGEPGGGVGSSVERLLDALENRRLVLVLDNCEHLLDAVARLAAQLLARAPQVRILATSREPLGITGETLCPVPSLPLPLPGEDPREALEHAAVRLFADRAAAVRPGFRVDAATAPLVVGICRALDGIPLAIELAAARMRSLTLRQISARLGNRFRLLSGGDRAALPRHQTLRAVVDWSWELLDDAERGVLRRLSVFAGGATPENAEQVCAPGGTGAPAPGGGPGPVVDGVDVVDVIASLIDKSLVMASGDGRGEDGDGEVRYHLLETVRAYATERLEESGEAASTRSAHAACFLALAERAEPELRRQDQLHWAMRLSAERDNYHAALGHVIETGDAATALRLLGALVWFWIICDYATEAGSWALAVRELVGDTPPPGLADAYAMCTYIAVLVATLSGDPEPDPETIRQAVAAALERVPERPRHPALFLVRPSSALLLGDLPEARQGLLEIIGHPDPWVQATAHVGLGHVALTEGRLDEAARELGQGYGQFKHLGERWGRNAAIGGLLELALIRGDGTEAVRLGEEAYDSATAEAGLEQCALVLIQLGRARAEAGDLARAREDIERGVSTAERLGEHGNAAAGLLALSDLARRTGDLPGAREPLLRALEVLGPRAERADQLRMVALTFSRLGCLAEQEDDLAAAAEWHAKAMATVHDRRVSDNGTLAAATEGLAALAAARGENERAAELLGTAHTLHGYRAARSLEVGRVTVTAASALGTEAFEAAYERGRRATVEHALALMP